MGIPNNINEVRGVEDAAAYIKLRLLAPGLDFDDRAGVSICGELARELGAATDEVREIVHQALLKCLSELHDPSTSWYENRPIDGARADDLLLFTSMEGVVVDSNRREALRIIDSTPDYIIELQRELRKSISDRCLAVMLGLLHKDEISQEFINKNKGKYPKEFWERRGDITGMEIFHGVSSAYSMMLGSRVDYDLLWRITIAVGASDSSWEVILKKKAENPLDKAIHAAIRMGIDDDFDIEELRKLALPLEGSYRIYEKLLMDAEVRTLDFDVVLRNLYNTGIGGEVIAHMEALLHIPSRGAEEWEEYGRDLARRGYISTVTEYEAMDTLEPDEDTQDWSVLADRVVEKRRVAFTTLT